MAPPTALDTHSFTTDRSLTTSPTTDRNPETHRERGNNCYIAKICRLEFIFNDNFAHNTEGCFSPRFKISHSET